MGFESFCTVNDYICRPDKITIYATRRAGIRYHQDEHERQLHGIELIASENFVSDPGHGGHGIRNDK